MIEARKAFDTYGDHTPDEALNEEIEAIVLDVAGIGAINNITPSFIRTVKVLLLNGDEPIRVTRNERHISKTQMNHFDKLVKHGYLKRGVCLETGKQTIKTGSIWKKLRNTIHD